MHKQEHVNMSHPCASISQFPIRCFNSYLFSVEVTYTAASYTCSYMSTDTHISPTETSL